MRAERSRDVTGASPPRRRPNERADVAEFHFKTRASGAGNSIGVPHGGSMCCGGALRLNGATRGAVAPIRCASSRNAPVALCSAIVRSACPSCWAMRPSHRCAAGTCGANSRAPFSKSRARRLSPTHRRPRSPHRQPSPAGWCRAGERGPPLCTLQYPGVEP